MKEERKRLYFYPDQYTSCWIDENGKVHYNSYWGKELVIDSIQNYIRKLSSDIGLAIRVLAGIINNK